MKKSHLLLAFIWNVNYPCHILDVRCVSQHIWSEETDKRYKMTHGTTRKAQNYFLCNPIVSLTVTCSKVWTAGINALPRESTWKHHVLHCSDPICFNNWSQVTNEILWNVERIEKNRVKCLQKKNWPIDQFKLENCDLRNLMFKIKTMNNYAKVVFFSVPSYSEKLRIFFFALYAKFCFCCGSGRENLASFLSIVGADGALTLADRGADALRGGIDILPG